MKKLILLFLLIPFMGLAQDKGTRFEHGLSWAQVREKAMKENKYLFVDCYTTWCGPCIYMANTIFPQEKVGAFFNKNFVNVKVQFDKTKNDSEEVKSWYADMEAINKAYKIQAYPTFLIFSPKGELVHKVVGGDEADKFIPRVEKALNPETQYYTLLKKYEAGKANPETLRQLATMAKDAYEQENADKIAAAYLQTQSNLYTKENLEFLSKFAESSKTKGFQLMLKEPEKFDAVLGKGKSNEMLGRVIVYEEIRAKRKSSVNLDSLIKAAKSKYPTVDINKSTELLQVQDFQSKKDWPKFQTSVMAYMEKYGSEVDAGTTWSFARTIFENCHDSECVAAAMAWSKKNVEDAKSKQSEYLPIFLDTYANLLYKMGKKDEAISIKKKAVDLVPAAEKPTYQATLDKMQKGEKTWGEK